MRLQIREIRKSLGYSLDDLARVAGIAPQTLGAIERVGYIPRKDVIDRLCAVLGEEIRNLFTEEDK